MCCTMMLLIYYLFFFSSRRRHTRWPRDWSSDVCSSDLSPDDRSNLEKAPFRHRTSAGGSDHQATLKRTTISRRFANSEASAQIGRASCRERVYISVVAGG